MFTQSRFDGHRLVEVVQRGGGAVSADVINIGGIQPGIDQGLADRPGSSGSALCRGGDVIGIGRLSVADDFTQNCCTPGLGVLQRFDNQHPGPFTGD